MPRSSNATQFGLELRSQPHFAPATCVAVGEWFVANTLDAVSPTGSLSPLLPRLMRTLRLGPWRVKLDGGIVATAHDW